MVGGPINVPTVVAVIVVLLLQLGSRQPASLSDCTSSGIWSSAGNIAYHVLVGLEPLLTSASLFTVLRDQKLHHRNTLCLRRWAAVVPCTSHLLSTFLNQGSAYVSELQWWISPLASALLIKSNQDNPTSKAAQLSMLYTLSLAAAVLDFAQQTRKHLTDPNLSTSATTLRSSPTPQPLAFVHQLIRRALLLAATHIALALWCSTSAPPQTHIDPKNPNPQNPSHSPPSAAPPTEAHTPQKPPHTSPVKQHPRVAELPAGWRHVAGAVHGSGEAAVLDGLLSREGAVPRDTEAAKNTTEPLATPFTFEASADVNCSLEGSLPLPPGAVVSPGRPRPQPATNFPQFPAAILPERADGSIPEQPHGWHGHWEMERCHILVVRLLDAAVLAYQLLTVSSAVLAATDDDAALGRAMHGAVLSTAGGQGGQNSTPRSIRNVDVYPVPGACEAMSRRMNEGAALGPFLLSPAGPSHATAAAAAAVAASALDSPSPAAALIQELRWLGALLVALWGGTVLVLNAIWVLWPRAQRPRQAAAVNSAASWLASIARAVLFALLNSSTGSGTGDSHMHTGSPYIGSPGSGALILAVSVLFVHLLASNLPLTVFASQSAAAAAGAILLHRYHSPSEQLAHLAALYGGLWLAAVLVSHTLARAFSPPGDFSATLPTQPSSVETKTSAATATSDVPDASVTTVRQPTDGDDDAASAAAAAAAAALLANTEGEQLQALFGPDASISAVRRLPPLLLAQALLSTYRSRNCSPQDCIDGTVTATGLDSLPRTQSWSASSRTDSAANANHPGQGPHYIPSPFGPPPLASPFIGVNAAAAAAAAGSGGDGGSDAGGQDPAAGTAAAMTLGARQGGRLQAQALESARQRTTHMPTRLLDPSSLDSLPVLLPSDGPRLVAQAAPVPLAISLPPPPPPHVLQTLAGSAGPMADTAIEPPIGSPFDALVAVSSGLPAQRLLPSGHGRHPLGSVTSHYEGLRVRRASSELVGGRSNAPPYALPQRNISKGEGMGPMTTGLEAAVPVNGAGGVPPPCRSPSASPAHVILPQSLLVASSQGAVLIREGRGVSVGAREDVNKVVVNQAYRPTPTRAPSYPRLPSPMEAEARARLQPHSSAPVPNAAVSPAPAGSTPPLDQSALSSTILDADMYDRLLSSASSPFLLNTSGLRAARITSTHSTGTLPLTSLAAERRIMYRNSSGLSELSCSMHGIPTAGAPSPTGRVGPSAVALDSSLTKVHQEDVAVEAHRLGAGVGAVWGLTDVSAGRQLQHPIYPQYEMLYPQHEMLDQQYEALHGRGMRAVRHEDVRSRMEEQEVCALLGVEGQATIASTSFGSIGRGRFERTSADVDGAAGERQVIVLPDGRQVYQSETLAAASAGALNLFSPCTSGGSAPTSQHPQPALLDTARKTTATPTSPRLRPSSRLSNLPSSSAVPWNKISGSETSPHACTDGAIRSHLQPLDALPVLGLSSPATTTAGANNESKRSSRSSRELAPPGSPATFPRFSFGNPFPRAPPAAAGRYPSPGGGSVSSSNGSGLTFGRTHTGTTSFATAATASGSGSYVGGGAGGCGSSSLGAFRRSLDLARHLHDTGLICIGEEEAGHGHGDDESGALFATCAWDASTAPTGQAECSSGPISFAMDHGYGFIDDDEGEGGQEVQGSPEGLYGIAFNAFGMSAERPVEAVPVSAPGWGPDGSRLSPSLGGTGDGGRLPERRVACSGARPGSTTLDPLSQQYGTLLERQQEPQTPPRPGPSVAAASTTTDTIEFQVAIQGATSASVSGSFLSETRPNAAAAIGSGGGGGGGNGSFTSDDSTPRVFGASRFVPTATNPTITTTRTATTSTAALVLENPVSGVALLTMHPPNHPLTPFSNPPLQHPPAPSSITGVSNSGAVARHLASGGSQRSSSNPSLLSADMTLGCMLPASGASALPSNMSGGAVSTARATASTVSTGPSGSAGRGSRTGLMLAASSHSGVAAACSVNGSDGRLGVIVDGRVGSRPTLPELLASTAAVAAAIHTASAVGGGGGGGCVSAVAPCLWTSPRSSATVREAAPGSASLPLSIPAGVITNRQTNPASYRRPSEIMDGYSNITVQSPYRTPAQAAAQLTCDVAAAAAAGGPTDDPTSAVLPSQPLSQLLSQPLDSTQRTRYAWFGIFLKRTGSTAGHMGGSETPVGVTTPYTARPSGWGGTQVPEGYVIGGGRTSRTSRLSGALQHSQSLSIRVMDDTARLSSVKGVLRGLRKRIRSSLKNLGGMGGSGVGSSRGSFDEES